jgi:PleD family two-component response regulator
LPPIRNSGAKLGIVESHGGSCEITDGLEGRGTTLRVYLPAAEQAARAAVVTKPAVAQPGSGMLLVVDDDPVVRRAVAAALTNLGYTTVEAENGMDAVDIYRTHHEARAVVLDMVMPSMNGKRRTTLRELIRTSRSC